MRSNSMPPKSPRYSAHTTASPHTPRLTAARDAFTQRDSSALQEVASPHTPHRAEAFSKMMSHLHESGTATAPGSATAHSSSLRAQNAAEAGMLAQPGALIMARQRLLTERQALGACLCQESSSGACFVYSVSSTMVIEHATAFVYFRSTR